VVLLSFRIWKGTPASAPDHDKLSQQSAQPRATPQLGSLRRDAWRAPLILLGEQRGSPLAAQNTDLVQARRTAPGCPVKIGEPESGSTKSIGTTHISPYTPHDPQPAD
jgi:hypothetical protein